MVGKKPETMVNRVYQGVHNAIRNRSLRPGMKLAEGSLAELFSVSRTSVRAALKQLESDGLVTTEHNKRASVALPSYEEVRSLYETRRLIEVGIVTELCRRRDLEAILYLRNHLRLEDEARSRDDKELLSHLLGEFHTKLAMSLKNPVLLDWFHKLISRSSLYAAALDDNSHNVCRDCEHQQLVDQIEAGNLCEAIDITCTHLNGVENAILDLAARLKANYHPLQHLIAIDGKEPALQ